MRRSRFFVGILQLQIRRCFYRSGSRYAAASTDDRLS
jgi:hypothetical protein